MKISNHINFEIRILFLLFIVCLLVFYRGGGETNSIKVTKIENKVELSSAKLRFMFYQLSFTVNFNSNKMANSLLILFR